MATPTEGAAVARIIFLSCLPLAGIGFIALIRFVSARVDGLRI